MQKRIDQIGNFHGLDESTPWPSWKKGEKRREQIMEMLRENPNLSIQQIALNSGISIVQARRHRTKLVANGLWKLAGCGIILSLSFISGAYYANNEGIDEWMEERVKFPILHAQENLLWNLEQKFL